MNLRKELEKLLQNEEVKFVKIGSGTSFFYCSYLNDDIFEKLDSISKMYHKRYKTDLSKFKAKYPHCKKDSKELLGLKIERTVDYLEHWKDLLDRKVKDVYESISHDEPCTWIIIIDGREMGDYWTLKEFMSQE